jgi:hypothetical protein
MSQVATGKRLESHDEQLMLIILMVGRYNMQRYCDVDQRKVNADCFRVGSCSPIHEGISSAIGLLSPVQNKFY